jgi:hypothetical protein
MKRPQDIASIVIVLAWLAWFAEMLGAMAGAAAKFGPKLPGNSSEGGAS